MKRLLIVLMLSALAAAPLAAQAEFGGVKGTVVSRSGRVPVEGAQLVLSLGGEQIASVVSGSDGSFLIEDINNGDYRMTVTATGFSTSIVNVTIEGYVKDLIFVSLTPDVMLIEVDDANFAEFDMDDSGYQDVPAILSSSSDVFDNMAGYKFSAARFRPRGFDNSTQDVYLSGVRMNDAITGYSPYSLWSGLNEATRAKENATGVSVSDYGIGGYNGLSNIIGTASAVRPGARFSVLTNSAFYRLRLMASYATGEMDNGWSFAANVSTRLGGNDWVNGVYYRSFAYYLAAEKNFYDIHRLSLTVFGSPVQRGAQMASTQEVYDLVGSNFYNANWGYQNGVVRNARVRNNHEPVALLKYSFTPTSDFELDATLIYRTGRNGYSAMDWYDAPDPRPDYYRNLPSYFYNPDPNYEYRDNEFLAGWAEEAWRNNFNGTQQINWDRMYNVNYASLDKDGLRRSKYILEERRADQHDINAAIHLKWRASDHFILVGGANYRWNRTEHYKIVKDLLGGDYFVNIDSFAERDFGNDIEMIQNDFQYYLQHGEAQKVKVGDKYGYDYYAHVRDAKAWASGNFEFGQLKASVAGEIGYSTFWREGLVQKGLFKDNSLGKSESPEFLTYAVKGGLSYSISGHRIYANAGYFNDAPYFTQSFVSPRTRNSIVPNLVSQKTFSADVNYAFSKNGYDLRVTAYYAVINDQTDMMSFYDDSQNSYTNFAMSGIDQRHMGIELGFELPLPVTGLFVQGAANIGDYVYTSTPYVTQTVDNNGEVILDNVMVPYWSGHNIYAKDPSGNYMVDESGNYVVEKVQSHYVPSTPQIAASIGLTYRGPNYLFAGIDLQYFDKMYLDMNPLYRTDIAVNGPDGVHTPLEEEYMASQERFAPQFVLNANFGKSWYINRKYNIGVSLEIKNILNNTSFRTGGFEQTRLIDSENKERYYRFDSKYFYMQGINYMLNIYFRF